VKNNFQDKFVLATGDLGFISDNFNNILVEILQ
jgi:hypothetical protein